MENDENERDIADAHKVLRRDWPLIALLSIIAGVWLYAAWVAIQAAMLPPIP